MTVDADAMVARIDALPPTEQRIMTLLLDRLEAGVTTFGPWPRHDSRDLADEAMQEVIDGLHYSAAALLSLRSKDGDT